MIWSRFVLFMLRSQLESESRRDERALIKAGAATHALCAKQETWLIELPIPILIRNLCPSPTLSSTLNSGGRSNTAFEKTHAHRPCRFLLLPERARARPI